MEFKSAKTVQTVAIFILIAIAIFLFRSFYTTLPEMEDALKKWEIATAMAASNDLSLLLAKDHHSARWGIIFPVVIAIKFFGPNLTSFYFITLTLYGFFFAFLVFAIRREVSPGLTIAFAIILFYEPMFFRATAQIQPFIFGVFYLSCALWLMTIYIEKNRSWILVLSAIFAFFAYGAKETYLFFMVGMVALLYWKSGYKSVLGYCAILLFLLGIETLVFNKLSGNLVMGRIEFLAGGKHLVRLKQETEGLFDYLFYKWLRLGEFNQFLSVLALLGMCWVISAGRLIELKTLSIGIIFMAISYTILVSIVPKSLDPLIPIQPPRTKYLTPLMPFYVFVIFIFISKVLEQVSPNIRKLSTVSISGFAGVFMLYCVVFESPFKYRIPFLLGTTIHPSKEAMFWKHGQLVSALRDGYGVCARRTMKLVITQRLIQSYMNETRLLDELEISHMGDYRVLHATQHDPEHLKGHFFHYELYTPIPKEKCYER